ncbi:S16 family serine protease [Mycoplasma bradburyae]|uniref:Lon protease n=1 Tax=Mycoplasma bradburyae TaxID=2963128 RepID=A0ABT5GA94_9MOLU|nr:S16 family serine protease [Mycoplasma bradburyae]MDC4181703.1 AAA family ATPase [Mycoplasma bradburyae]UTS70251.1 AAA family ATPase [Mycoplasma bradburyae]
MRNYPLIIFDKHILFSNNNYQIEISKRDLKSFETIKNHLLPTLNKKLTTTQKTKISNQENKDPKTYITNNSPTLNKTNYTDTSNQQIENKTSNNLDQTDTQLQNHEQDLYLLVFASKNCNDSFQKEQANNNDIYDVGTLCSVKDIKENIIDNNIESYTINLEAIDIVKLLDKNQILDKSKDYSSVDCQKFKFDYTPRFVYSLLTKQFEESKDLDFCELFSKKEILDFKKCDHKNNRLRKMIYKKFSDLILSCLSTDSFVISKEDQIKVLFANNNYDLLNQFVFIWKKWKYKSLFLDKVKDDNELNNLLSKQKYKKNSKEKIIDLLVTKCDVFKNIEPEKFETKKEIYMIKEKQELSSENNAIPFPIYLRKWENDTIKLKSLIRNNPYPENIKDLILNDIDRISRRWSDKEKDEVYVEWLINLPWWQKTEETIDIKTVKKHLNDSHYGLEKIKEEILEYLVVAQNSKINNNPIICLVGPPGVGKTTIAKSIAKALNRKFAKFSLGGVSDELTIRGSSKNYNDARPGRILKIMKDVGVINPVILLDEIDKMTSGGSNGDPNAVMLEVLDTTLNKSFNDHYLDANYDLSNVMFIATANYFNDIPEPLRDRMLVINLEPYTEKEKFYICKNHIIKQKIEEYDLDSKEISFDDKTIEYIINHYTREAGVRELTRCIDKIIRSYIVDKACDKNIKSSKVNIDVVKRIFNKERYNVKKRIKRKPNPGVVNGLYYSKYGGGVLSIEVGLSDGDGSIQITGNVKDVMFESVNVAISFIKIHAEKLGIDIDIFKKKNIYIHIPNGAMPKEGPSAGIAITTAILSALKNKTIDSSIAMTGEITLTGKVLEVGGLKAKLLGGVNSDINTFYIPEENSSDLNELIDDDKHFNSINFIKVNNYLDIYNDLFNETKKKKTTSKHRSRSSNLEQTL